MNSDDYLRTWSWPPCKSLGTPLDRSGRPPDLCRSPMSVAAAARCIYINSPPTPPCWVSPHHLRAILSLNVCVCAVHRIGAVIWGSGGVKPVMVGGRGRIAFGSSQSLRMTVIWSIARFLYHYPNELNRNVSGENINTSFVSIFPLIGFPPDQRTESWANAFCNFDKFILQLDK